MQAQRRHRNPPPLGDPHAPDAPGGLWHERVAANDLSPSLTADDTRHVGAARPRRERVPVKAPRRNPVIWGLLGFALGIAFWHAIGFWGFIASVVLPQPADPAMQSQRLLDQRDTPKEPRAVSPARPTRAANAPPQAGAGKAAAATAPPRMNEPQREMPLPGWGTTVVTAETAPTGERAPVVELQSLQKPN